MALAATFSASAQQKYTVSIKNNLKSALNDVPATLDLRELKDVKSATVIVDGKEIPYQIDDLDGNGTNDELCFLVDLEGKQTKTATITLSNKADSKLICRDGAPQSKGEREKQARYLPFVYHHR